MITSIKIPEVSIVTVVLNTPEGFARTAASVLGLTFSSFEWIVIDGGSGEQTKDLIREFRKHIMVYISEPDRGPYDAMNKGLARASGEWVIFMNAGDTFTDPGVLTRIFATGRKEADVIYGDCIVDYGRFRILKKAGYPGILEKGMPFSHQSMLVRTTLAKTAGFDLNYPVGADYDMVLRLLFEEKRFVYWKEPIATIEPHGISHRNMVRSAMEHFRIAGRYREPSRIARLNHWGRTGFLFTIQQAYRILPMAAMHWFIRLINRDKVIPFTNKEIIEPAR